MMLRATLLAATAAVVSAAENICTTENNTFTVVVDLFAGELGYFKFEECGDTVNPTIGIEVGQSYTFIQKDRSNWFHPLGFAYYPDGAHADQDELEPAISQSENNWFCAVSNDCPTPRYFRDDEFLGVEGTDDFGLDVYEPEFFASPTDWAGAGTYSIELTFDDPAYAKDIFYFCHIHEYMSGRIKILKDGVPVSTEDDPPLEYTYDEPGVFDKTCGSYGLDAFQLPNPVCPEQFVCGVDESNQALADFSACIDAMNCKMLAGMTTGVKASSQTALFCHQMIPHHQNAVNMAKAILSDNIITCEDLADEDNQECVMEVILREIVNTQNHQIQKMVRYLESEDYPLTDNCDVEIETIRIIESVSTPAAAPVEAPVESPVEDGGTVTSSANKNSRAMRAVQEICTSETNTFTAVVDLFAGELGYFKFEECGDTVNPTIGIEVGQSYTFIQKDRSNWFHPLGFAYYPDGAHADQDELEPTISQTGSNCADSNECPSPRYFRDDEFLGVEGTDDFGLDVYEPEFFASPGDWFGAGTYSIELTFDDPAYTKDIFYFCHVHEYMSGRIKILKDGVPVSSEDDPPLGYAYDEPSVFDETCGTYGLDAFQLPNPVCPAQFVCGVDESKEVLAKFSACIDAMNCHQLAGMTTGVKASSQTALFVHQMIPHHQNAVNMAKALLHENVLVCEDLADEDNQECVMEVILREIVNTQNHQIQKMVRYLESNDYPLSDDCDVEIETVSTVGSNEAPVAAPVEGVGFSSAHNKFSVMTAVIFAVAGGIRF